MKQTEHPEKNGKSYRLFYRGKTVTEITLESGKELTRAKAYEIVEGILRRENPGMWVWKELLHFTEIG